MQETLATKPDNFQTNSLEVERFPQGLPTDIETIIEARPGWKAINLAELWRYRELLYFLTWRDIKVRYKQSLLGAAWAILQPLMYMIVFTIVFGRMANVPTDGIPYPLFSFAALLPWTLFSAGVTQAGNSMISSSELISKVYFPRLAIPFASVGAALFDFVVSFGMLLVIIAYYVIQPQTHAATISLNWSLLLVPPLVVLVTLAALGVGAVLGALSVAFRDFKHTIPFLVQLWMFATPAIYLGTDHAPATGTNERIEAPAAASQNPGPASEGAVSDTVQSLLEINPMNGLVRSFRAAILGQPIPWASLGLSSVVIITVFVAGCIYFHRVEDTFADII